MMKYWEFILLVIINMLVTTGGSSMKMQIKVNPDTQKAKEIREKVKENDGYCPCSLFKMKIQSVLVKNF